MTLVVESLIGNEARNETQKFRTAKVQLRRLIGAMKASQTPMSQRKYPNSAGLRS
jgi:hypothetical protein